MRIGIGQLNPTVGDISGNAGLIVKAAREAREKKCDLFLCPEMMLTGYPPEDLLFKPAFIQDNLAALKRLAPELNGLAAVIGFVDFDRGRRYNAAAWIEDGKIKEVYRKQLLPNYGVFDEQRYFVPGDKAVVRTVAGTRVGLTICEDIWSVGPHLKRLKAKRPDLVVNISASPFHRGKLRERQQAFKKTLSFLKTPMVYCNMVGGQDELVFDGGSFVELPNGRVPCQAPQFKSGCYILDQSPKNAFSLTGEAKKPVTGVEEVFDALVLGIRDYVLKNNFGKVTLGISGGIDSALVAALAVEALGKENVIGVTMPSRYNISATRQDAATLARNLGIRLLEIPIESIFAAYASALAQTFKGTQPNSAEENLQARIRGGLLMALSNKFGWLVLTTGNKSEVSTGYCTLYGDMVGGFSVLKDVLKTTVYDLSRFINQKAGHEVIPASVIARPPTAELRENQKDEDALGPYAELDPLIVGYIENNLPLPELTKRTQENPDYIRRILNLIDRNEYKRRQAPPGIKITPRSFGRDHRMPITNRYKS